VFGLLKRGGKVYAMVIPDAKGKTLKAIIEDKVVPDSIVYSDTFSSYNVLDVSSFKHYRINHSETLLRSEEPHQWHRELLESDQASHAPFQRHPRYPLPPLLERV
jgi:transposase